MIDTENKEIGTTKKDPYLFDKIADRVIDYLGRKGKFPLFHKEQFYIYDGKKYIKEDELAGHVRAFLHSHKLPQSNNIVGNVKEIVQSRSQRIANDYGDMPFFAGAGFPKPENIIAYNNGILDVSQILAGKEADLLPHTPKWFSASCLPYDYDPSARCEMWLNFLDEVYEGRQNCISILQEFFGLCLTSDTSFQKFLMMKGVSGAGKGTIIYILLNTVGTQNSCGYNLNLLSESFGLQMLLDKSLAVVGENELDKNIKRCALQMLNSIVGQDAVAINRKGMPIVSMQLNTRFVIGCNQLPAYADPCGALGRRMLLLEHRRSFRQKEDTGLREKLMGEISGINRWALQGLVRLRTNGKFTDDPDSTAAKNIYRRNNSPAFAFLQDCLVIGRRLNPGDLEVEMSDSSLGVEGGLLRSRWDEWCVLNDVKEGDFNWMMRNLYDILPGLPVGRRVRIDGRQTMFYDSIGLKLRF